jgi:hypothetical protein
MEKILSNGSHENYCFSVLNILEPYSWLQKYLIAVSVSHSECATIEQVLPVAAETGWE